MRDWHLTTDNPLSMRFAADTRLGRTDYTDDQSWEVVFGGPQEPAISIQTRYGGRAGLARLVPMWILDNHSVYETAAFAERPALVAFAPNYCKIAARPLENFHCAIELWVMDSHALGGRFTMRNDSKSALSLRLELFAQVVREGEVIDMNLLGLDDGNEALHLGVIGNLNPILMMENAAASASIPGEHVSPKLSAPLNIPAGGEVSIRWVHAGRPSLNDSLQDAFKWLYRTSWDDFQRLIEQTNTATPVIETGNPDWDAALAFSAQVVLRSFVGPTNSLPTPSFVSARIPSRGFSPRGDGSDYGWQWSGQSSTLDYLVLPAAAILSPDLACGAIRNLLAVRQSDGWIDYKPGLAGQRSSLLSLPLLATTAWRIYETTEDSQFINDVFPGLQQFFERWFQPDMDRDQDGLPEWTNTSQSVYTENPIFGRYRRWAQNADINKAESPDLAAYLIAEGQSLLQMSDLINKPQVKPAIQARIDSLVKHLEAMWNNGTSTYQYRDRDTDTTVTGQNLFSGKGDEAFDTRTRLDPANRLILRVIGGKDHAPRVSAVIEGIDVKGNAISETVPTVAFAWYYGMGAAVSEHVFSQVNYVKFEGVSRVYSVEISTVDLTRDNQTLLVPLWAKVINQERAALLVKAITDPARYWRTYGMPVCPADDPVFAANNDGGSGGVWLLWNTMIIEGLLHYGYHAEAATLFSRIMDAQVKSLKSDHAFREIYNSETGEGMGDLDELGGVIPLQLVMQMIGVRFVNARKVWTGGPFAFPSPVKVTQFGIEVTRSAKEITIRFPSGYTATVGAEWQAVEDPTPVAPPPEPPAVEPEPTPESVQTPDLVEPPSPASIIPVDAKKDDTLEIPVSQIDFEPKKDEPSRPADAPGTIRIPVKGPNKDQ